MTDLAVPRQSDSDRLAIAVLKGADRQDARRGRAIINQNIILSLLIIAVLLPLAITGVLGLAAVVLVHEVAEVIVIGNGLRAATTRRTALEPLTDRQAQPATTG